MELVDAERIGNNVSIGRGDTASRQDHQTARGAVDACAQLIEIILDGRSGLAAMRQDAIDAGIGQKVDCLELALGIEGIERHMERRPQLPSAHLAHAVHDLHEPLQALDIDIERTLDPRTALEAADDHAVDPVRGGNADIGLHSLELRLAVHEIAFARPDDRTDLSPLVLAHDRNGLLDHAHRWRGPANREVVAQLDAAGACTQGGIQIGEVLGAIFIQHISAPLHILGMPRIAQIATARTRQDV